MTSSANCMSWRSAKCYGACNVKKYRHMYTSHSNKLQTIQSSWTHLKHRQKTWICPTWNVLEPERKHFWWHSFCGRHFGFNTKDTIFYVVMNLSKRHQTLHSLAPHNEEVTQVLSPRASVRNKALHCPLLVWVNHTQCDEKPLFLPTAMIGCFQTYKHTVTPQ